MKHFKKFWMDLEELRVSELVKCPYCGYIFRINITQHIEEGQTFITRGLWDRSKQSPAIERIDLTCPHCKEIFEYTVTS